MEVPLSLLVLAAVPVTGCRLRGTVAGGVSSAAADAVLRIAHSFVARRALHACVVAVVAVAAVAVVGVADVAAMASAAAVIGARASAASCFV